MAYVYSLCIVTLLCASRQIPTALSHTLYSTAKLLKIRLNIEVYKHQNYRS